MSHACHSAEECGKQKYLLTKASRCQDSSVAGKFSAACMESCAPVCGAAVKNLCFIATVFLILSLSCAEIPELLTVTDNSSNDFVVSASNSKLPSVQPLLNNVGFTIRDKNFGSLHSPLEPAFISQFLPTGGRDLLILHSLQKK